jgi:FkbM family methyltransferase
MKHLIGKIDAVVNCWRDHAYTSRKVRRSRIPLHEPLTYAERLFCLEFMPALSGENLVVYDIGAASGMVSGFFAKLASVRVVHAFEPLTSAFAELTDHTRHWPHVTRHNVALGDENGTKDIHVIGGSRDSSSLLKIKAAHHKEFRLASLPDHLEKVSVFRLDDYAQAQKLPLPHLIKIDVQGYENRVLSGGGQTIAHASYCILEISLTSLYEGSPLFDDIYQQMRELGFRLIGVGNLLRGASGRHLQLDGIFQNEKQM